MLAREYSDQERWPVHRMTVDTYAVQHPGTPSPQSIQSVAIHLVRLHLALERGLEPAAANAVMQRAAGDGGKPSPLAGHTRWLDPPAALQQTVTAVDVHRAADAAEHRAAVERWAAAVWDAWRDHHAVVREWAAVVVGE